MNEKIRLFILSSIIALVAGLFATAFDYAVHHGTLFSKGLMSLGDYWKVIIPIGILIIYMIVKKPMEAYDTSYGVKAVQNELENIKSQVMTIPHVASKLFLSAISISAGFAVGSFGPTAHIGGAIGSQVAYGDKFDDDTRRILIAMGTAAALSAVQRSPLFSTIFVMEVVLAGNYFKYIIPILYASVLATIVDYTLVGGNNAYSILSEIKTLEVDSSIETLNLNIVFSIAIIAIFIGVVGGLYIFFLSEFNFIYSSKNKNRLLTVFIVGVTCVLALISSDFLYVDTSMVLDTHMALNAPFSPDSIRFLAILLFVKLMLSTSQQGFGIHGGNFKPGLYFGLIGGMLIYAVLNYLGIQTPSYPIVMLISAACVISSFANAPLSAIVLAVETIEDTGLIIPIIMAVIIAHLSSRVLVNKAKNKFY